MRMAPHVHQVSQEYVANMVGMGRIDLGVLGAGEVVDIVALDGLVQERRPQQQDHGQNKRQPHVSRPLW